MINLVKKIFIGKKKFLTIPIAFFLLVFLFPIVAGTALAYLVYKRIAGPKLKYLLLVIITLFSLFANKAWIASMTDSDQSDKKQTIQPTNLPTKKSETQIAETQPEASTAAKEIKPTPTTIVTNKETAKVSRVIDGDTVAVVLNGKRKKVRIIGIDTPETVDTRKSIQCFGKKASAIAKQKLTGETVLLEIDPTQGEKDKYGRLLRYIWTNNGKIDFGKFMITAGYAYEYTYKLPYKYQQEYKQAEKEARETKKGLWADDACPSATPKPTVTSRRSSKKKASAVKQGNCQYSCNGPDRNCADFSTHAEAQAFFNCCGFTATNDPMRLDSIGIGDGVACESLP